MARYQINHYVDLPVGKLHIYVDPIENAKAEKLLKDSPKILWAAWEDAANRFGKKIVKEALRCIDTGMPPKGVNWPPLSKKYVSQVSGDNRIYFKTGQYYQEIDIHKENVYYQSGAFARPRYFVGLPLGVDKWGVRYEKKKPISLLRVAQILEQGSPKMHIPPRPLWKPLFDSAGGKERIKLFVNNAIKRQLSKYM